MTIVSTPAPRAAAAPTPEAIEKAAGEAGMARAIVAALLAPVAILGHQLLELLRRGDEDPSRAVDWSLMRRRLLRAVRGPLVNEAERGARRATADIGVSFELVPTRAIAAAETHAAALVHGITDTARSAVRDIIVRGQREGLSVDVVAAEVRDVIGLHPRWARAVANRHRYLASQNTPPARVDKLVAAYRSRLLDTQARTIARTELLRSSNAGAMEGYRQAESAFPDGLVREWVTAREDGRLCPICLPLNGRQVAGLEALYDTPLGPVLHPPLHPRCRCRQVIRPATSRRSAA
jgi:hypothetical protein